jgi:hypothetical protein
MSDYALEVTTTRPLPSMKVLMDAVADELERRGFSPYEYSVIVKGPPELSIGLRYKENETL